MNDDAQVQALSEKLTQCLTLLEALSNNQSRLAIGLSAMSMRFHRTYYGGMERDGRYQACLDGRCRYCQHDREIAEQVECVARDLPSISPR